MLQFEVFVLHYGYAAVFLFLALGIFGLPMPDEIVVASVGYFASIGLLNFFVAIVITILGVFSGTVVTYMMGRKFGQPLLIKYGKWMGITDTRFSHVEKWFHRHGSWAVTFGYFVPGMRHLVCYISGVSGMNMKRYLLFATLGTCISCIICGTFGYLIGHPLVSN